MNPAFKITTYVSKDAPANCAAIAYIWVTMKRNGGKRWERLAIVFEAASDVQARAKADQWWRDQIAKVAANKSATGKGRRNEYDFAPDFFKALEDLTDALKEHTESIRTAEGTDQRGYGLREDVE